MKWNLSHQCLELVYWVLPLDRTLMLYEADVNECQMVSTSSSRQPIQSYKGSSLWLSPLSLAASRMGLIGLQAWLFISMGPEHGSTND